LPAGQPARATLRQRLRAVVPWVDAVTYLMAAGVLAVTWLVGMLLDELGIHLWGLP
jgi:hypothetical protein